VIIEYLLLKAATSHILETLWDIFPKKTLNQLKEKMKKTIKKNWLKVLIISVSLLLINCSVEEEVISGSHFGPQNKKFTYSDFLKETKIKDFDIFSKYNVSRSINGVMQKTIQQDFITDTTVINRLEIPNTEKTTYSFKLYPVAEQLNTKEYYNMVVEKNGNQLTYMVFFNKDKQNPEPTEIKTQTSELVYHSRSPHQGFIEVISQTIKCNGSCTTGVCDGFACPTGECIHTTVSYVYVGINNLSGSNGNTGSDGSSGTSSSGDGLFDGIYIPNPYDGLDDPTNTMMILAGQINTFLNTLPANLKTLATSSGMYFATHAYFQQNGLTNTTKANFIQAINNFYLFLNNLNTSDLTFASSSNYKYWAFNTFLFNNANGINNTKINNVKNLLNNQIIESQTKEKIIDELATKNNQEVLDFVCQFAINATISGLNLDFEMSLKSPANIDFSAIDKNTPEGQHFTWIYEKLMASPKFKEMFIDTFGENPRLNIKFEIADNITVNGTCQLSSNSGNYKNTIRINKSLFGSHSNLNIAKTILHECIHAYLNILSINSSLISTTISELNNLNLQQLLGTINPHFSAITSHGPTQHEFMINYMIPVFKIVLNDIKSSLVSPNAINYIEQEGVWNLSDGTTYTFNWQDAYYFISLKGLHETSVFEILLPTGSLIREKYNLITSFLNSNLTKEKLQ
jgi:hypothetical protein